MDAFDKVQSMMSVVFRFVWSALRAVADFVGEVVVSVLALIFGGAVMIIVGLIKLVALIVGTLAFFATAFYAVGYLFLGRSPEALQNGAMMFGLFVAAVTVQVVIDKAGERLIGLGRKTQRQDQASVHRSTLASAPPCPTEVPLYQHARIVRPMLPAPADTQTVCGHCARMVNDCECVAAR